MRANTGIKTIEVNDQGESIAVNLNDAAMMTEYLSLIGEFEEASKKVAAMTADLTGAPEERLQKVKDAAALNLEVCTKLKGRVDEVFHDEVCRKVFGDIVPALPSFADFFAQLGALMREFNDERAAESQARIAKYTEKYKKRSE